MYNILVVHINGGHIINKNYSIILPNKCVLGFRALPSWCIEPVMYKIAYVIGELLEKAKRGGGLARNCDSDASKL